MNYINRSKTIFNIKLPFGARWNEITCVQSARDYRDYCPEVDLLRRK